MVGTEAVIMHSTPLNHPDHIVSHMRDMALSRSLSLSFERERSWYNDEPHESDASDDVRTGGNVVLAVASQGTELQERSVLV